MHTQTHMHMHTVDVFFSFPNSVINCKHCVFALTSFGSKNGFSAGVLQIKNNPSVSLDAVCFMDCACNHLLAES